MHLNKAPALGSRKKGRTVTLDGATVTLDGATVTLDGATVTCLIHHRYKALPFSRPLCAVTDRPSYDRYTCAQGSHLQIDGLRHGVRRPAAARDAARPATVTGRVGGGGEGQDGGRGGAGEGGDSDVRRGAMGHAEPVVTPAVIESQPLQWQHRYVRLQWTRWRRERERPAREKEGM